MPDFVGPTPVVVYPNSVSQKILLAAGPFGIRSGSVRGPFGIRSGSVRGPLGPISDRNFRSQTFKNSKSIVTLREAKRGSAGVPIAKCEAAGDIQSVQE